MRHDIRTFRIGLSPSIHICFWWNIFFLKKSFNYDALLICLPFFSMIPSHIFNYIKTIFVFSRSSLMLQIYSFTKRVIKMNFYYCRKRRVKKNGWINTNLAIIELITIVIRFFFFFVFFTFCLKKIDKTHNHIHSICIFIFCLHLIASCCIVCYLFYECVVLLGAILIF